MTTMAPSPRVAGTAHAGDAGGSPQRIPWSTVLPLAVVAAFGSGFWLIVIRGAVGSIERTESPFVTWLQESTLLVPLYVFAVLAALTLARRWFGAGPYRTGPVATTLLLVTLAVTLAASVVQAVSAVYDYRLQSLHVLHMASHELSCGAQCIADRQHDGLVLQVQALGLGSVVMLVSNLVLLTLVVTLRGGRLDIVSTRHHPGRVRRFNSTQLFLVTGLLGAAAIHAASIGGRLAQWPAAGIALLLLTIIELDAALLFLLRLRRVQYLAAATISAVPLLVWLFAHTVGLPFGPDAGVAAQIGLTETAAATLEAVVLVVALVALRSRDTRGPGTAQHPARLAIAGVVALSVIATAVGSGAMGSTPPNPHHGHHVSA